MSRGARRNREGDLSRREGLLAGLVTNTLAQVAGSGLASLIGLVTFVAITRALGPAAFGDLATAMAFLFLPVVLADLGLGAAVVREVLVAPGEAEAVMRASWPLRALIGLLGVAVAVGIGLAMPFSGPAKVAIAIGSVGSLFTLVTLAFQPVLQARLKMHLAVAASLAGRLTTLGATLAALAAGLGFKAVVVAQVLGLGVTLAAQLAIVARMVSLRPVIDLLQWRTLLRRSIVLGVAIALAHVYFRVDTLLLALLSTSTEVGLYGAAYRFIELTEIFVGAIGVTFFSPLARFLASRDVRVRALVQRTFDVSLALSVPIALVMIGFSEEIVLLTTGDEFREAAVALELLAPYVVIGFLRNVFSVTLIVADRGRILLAIYVAILALNVGLNVAFIPQYGFRAAAVITLCSEAAALALTAAAARRTLGFLPSVRYVVAVGLAGAGMAVAVLFTPGPFLLVALLASAVYVAALVAAPGTVRSTVRRLLPSGLRRS